MGIPLTLAVMPDQVHTRDAALSWRAHGLPVILYDADSAGSKNHLALAKEIINKNTPEESEK